MKRINLIPLAFGILLLASCNKDEAIQEQGFSPKITATADGATKTKAGIVEENADYATIGEQFYWSVGDASALFFGTERLDYTVATVGAQRNQANFTTTGTLTNSGGTYDITGFFPTPMWNFATLTATLPQTQTQTDHTSKHLSNYMLMKAHSEGVSVSDQNAINLGYNHLGAVVRILVWNNSSRTNAKLEKVELFALTSDGSNIFHLQGSLANKSATSLTLDASSQVNTVGVSMTGMAQDFKDIGGKRICEAYIVLLPSATMQMSDIIIVKMTMNDGVNSEVINDIFEVGTDLPFYSFEQGKSYYFKALLDDGYNWP